MKNKNEVKYRVYDPKGNYQQSYSGNLDGGYNWARDCAKRVGGYVMKYVLTSDNQPVSEELIIDLRSK